MENPHLPCSYYNCKRTYSSVEALHKHVQDHQQNPAQSLPGKSFLCSSIGCDGSFSNMQQLMDHMRHHHKPNYFFLCESCRAKLRSYRTLLKHLQTCAKVAKSKTIKVESSGPNDSGLNSTDVNRPGFFTPLENPQKMDSKSPMLSSTAPLVPASSGSSEHSESPTGTSAAIDSVKPYNQQYEPHSPFPPSLSPAPELEPQYPSRVSPPILVSSPPHTPPGSNAVWRKNQDLPAPILHRWNSPQALNREEVQGSHSAVAFFGNTLGGATAAFSVATLPPSARR